jgi:hypothetical protein
VLVAETVWASEALASPDEDVPADIKAGCFSEVSSRDFEGETAVLIESCDATEAEGDPMFWVAETT